MERSSLPVAPSLMMFSLRVGKKQYENLRVAAAETGITMAEIIRRAIDEWMENHTVMGDKRQKA